MAEPFLSEIRIAAFDFAPRGWAFCDGGFLPINQNHALYSLLGITFGGDGWVNFRLPDLRGRVPIHRSGSYVLGQVGGAEVVTISQATMPRHTHLATASSRLGNESAPGGNHLAAAEDDEFGAPVGLTSLHPASVRNTGGSQSHSNMQPYLTLNFMIALQGIFPSRS